MASKYSKFWEITEENRRSFRYAPYGKFGACYRPADLEAFARLKRIYEVELGAFALSVNILLRIPAHHSLFFTEVKFLVWGLIVGIGYVVINKSFVKSLDVVELGKGFWQAFQECALNANPRVLSMVQTTCGFMGVMLVACLRGHLRGWTAWFVLGSILFFLGSLFVMCAAMIAIQGTQPPVRRWHE